ncbi:MAG TPA: paraquat-inducible protein A [Steroidobacteraceae bacterium]|jgi:paraquat-inducible protein A|nr:paraquat-inducible protein A [Steroidobacteraceae bacterium]
MTIACTDCGTLQDIPPLPWGAIAICPTCDNRLERTNGRSINGALACASATFVLLFPANLLPLMHVSMLGMGRESRLGTGVVTLWQHQWVIVALLVAAFAVILPFIRFGLLSLVLALLQLGHRPHWLGRAFRWSLHLDQWAMPDVFLLGCAVGYSRIAAAMPVKIGWGGVCLIFAAFLCMLSRAALDRRAVWRVLSPECAAPAENEPAIACRFCDLVRPAVAEGSSCPRCGLQLTARKPDSMMRTAALVIAGFALFFPANLFPMSVDRQFGVLVPHRIVDGIMELFQAHLWPLGVLIFITSIAIPLLKLAGLSWLLMSVWHGSRHRLVLKTRLCRLIDEIGRWSCVDVFTIAVFLPIMQFHGMVSTNAANGAPAFLLVVVVTMLASHAFDPRLMWDAALAPRFHAQPRQA